jgi:2,5-furandicarboxylate decarboxylase 1
MKFREFLKSYLEHQPSETFVVNEGSIEYEPTAYYELLRKKNPLIFFERITNFPNFELVLNLFGNTGRIAAAMGTTNDRLHELWKNMMSGLSKPREVTDGPVRELIFKEDNLDVLSLPAPRHYKEDGGRYITAGLVVARDPKEPEIVNLSYARVQLLERNTIALSAHSRGHLWSYLQVNKERQDKTKLSFIIGAEPALYIAAAARIDNEYERVACVENLKLVRGLTNDLPVPAESEIVIEAEVEPDNEYDEGPFSEYTGYMSYRSTRTFAKVTGVMMRRNPIFLDIVPSNSTEHILLSSIAKELTLSQRIYEGLPPFGDYFVEWPAGGTHYVAFGSVGKPEVGLSKQLALSLLGQDHYLKIVMINEGFRIHRFFQFLANAEENGANQFGKDIEVINSVFCNRLDPSTPSDGVSSKAIWITRGTGEYSLEKADGRSALLETAKGKVFIGTQSPRKNFAISILVDHDIDPFDEDQVLWSIATRTQPGSDLHLKEGSVVLDSRKPEIAKRRPSLPLNVLEVVRKKLNSRSISC